MKTALITGSCGLIGSESAKLLHRLGFAVVGVDDDSRTRFFGGEATIGATRKSLSALNNYEHMSFSILDLPKIEEAMERHRPDFVIHTAGQPSHDWAADHPFEDFDANARGTLNVLHAAKKHAPECTMAFTSTNKVYGDRPNTETQYVERETRWEPEDSRIAKYGFDESLSVDQCKHSLFGVSSIYADMLVQEYGRYFGMKTGVFRLGCVTGPSYAGVEQHGFLSYLFRCFKEGKKYTIHGYKGKQVRDNIHAFDAASAFYEFYKNPHPGEVYNVGGSDVSNCSVLEAIKLIESIMGKKLELGYSDECRSGDHIWYISDMRKFKSHYPEWSHSYTFSTILEEMLPSLDKS